MKIPRRILGLARGPILATAALACSSPVATPESIPAPQRIVPDAPPDPVSYDAARESERLARADALATTEEERRSRRIEDQTDEMQRRHLQELAAHRREHYMRRCGRG